MVYEIEKNDAIENLKDGYEQIKSIYQLQSERLKASDEKLNMLLVFNAAIIALLIVVFPFPNNSILNILSIIIFLFFAISMLITLLYIFVGLFPRNLYVIDPSNFTDAKQYNCAREKYIGKYVSGYKEAIVSTIKVAEKKQKMIKCSMIGTIINIVLIIILIIIKII